RCQPPPFEVAGEARRPAHLDLTAADTEVAVREEAAGRGEVLARRAGSRGRDGRGHLGEAVRGDDGKAARVRFVEEPGRDGAAAEEEGAERRQRPVAVAEEPVELRGDERGVRGAEGAEGLGRGRLRRGDGHGRPRQRAAVDDGEAADVVEGEVEEPPVAGPEGEPLGPPPRAPHVVAGREERSLRSPRRAAGEDDGGRAGEGNGGQLSVVRGPPSVV